MLLLPKPPPPARPLGARLRLVELRLLPRDWASTRPSDAPLNRELAEWEFERWWWAAAEGGGFLVSLRRCDELTLALALAPLGRGLSIAAEARSSSSKQGRCTRFHSEQHTPAGSDLAGSRAACLGSWWVRRPGKWEQQQQASASKQQASSKQRQHRFRPARCTAQQQQQAFEKKKIGKSNVRVVWEPGQSQPRASQEPGASKAGQGEARRRRAGHQGRAPGQGRAARHPPLSLTSRQWMESTAPTTPSSCWLAGA